MQSRSVIGLLAICVVLFSGCTSTLVSRTYAVPRSVFKTVIAIPDPETGAVTLVEKQGAPVNDADIQEFFEEAGVSFPKGAYIRYDERREALTIRNTPQNLDLAEGILTSTDGSKPPRL